MNAAAPPPAPAAVDAPRVELFEHNGSTLNNNIRVFAVGNPDAADNAFSVYDLVVENPNDNNADPVYVNRLYFQDGPAKEVGPNGLTDEALLGVLIHRLSQFQNGAYACRENACARTHLQEALMWLRERTRARTIAGVEGTREKSRKEP